jgi:hypothetical protein
MTAPARRYSWPTATPGNTIALKHGAHSAEAIAATAAELRPRLFEIAPWLDPAQDVIAVDRFLRVEARSLRLDHYLNSLDEETSARLHKVHEQATAAARLAAQLGTSLGLDYRSRMQLRHTEASTEALSDVIEAGRRARLSGPDVIDADPVPEGEIEP